MKKLVLIFSLFISSAFASGDVRHAEQMKWEFDGFTGKFDYSSIQRGFQVHKEVCASCHSLNRIAYRNLQDIGFTENQAKSVASEYTVVDGPDDSGDMFERKAGLADSFAAPYPNENASRASNGGAYPPDLSLMIKARPDGANYVYSLLTGYEDVPRGFKMSDGMNYNPYFSNGQIAMPSPLSDDLVEYADGTKATIEQMSHDVVNFMQWASEPEMEKRKKMGVRTIIYLLIMGVFFIIAKKRVWKNVK